VRQKQFRTPVVILADDGRIMGKYSIRDLEKLSGVKAHTIRIWEKRHNIVAPERTDTNIRFYSDADLKKIINVSLLNSHGIRISQIAEMSAEDMNQRVSKLSESKHDHSVHIDNLVMAMVDIDEERFEKILSSLMLRFGFEDTVTEIVYPFLGKIGVLWQTANITPAHEHFISHLIRQKIIVAIDGLPLPPRTAKRAILFLPEGELHELGLLFCHYLARKYGFRTYYLGQSVPYADLVSVAAQHRPNVLITCLTSAIKGGAQKYLETLSKDFPNCLILASGLQVRDEIETGTNVRRFSRATELKEKLVQN
jgi:DNA-binding transcriptional MerR regulator